MDMNIDDLFLEQATLDEAASKANAESLAGLENHHGLKQLLRLMKVESIKAILLLVSERKFEEAFAEGKRLECAQEIELSFKDAALALKDILEKSKQKTSTTSTLRIKY